MHSEAAFLLNPNSKRFQNDSRLKQLHEINSCEQLNEMEEHIYASIVLRLQIHLFYVSISIKEKQKNNDWIANQQPVKHIHHWIRLGIA